MEEFLSILTEFGTDFTNFMREYLPKILDNIDALKHELDTLTLDDNEGDAENEQPYNKRELEAFSEASDEKTEDSIPGVYDDLEWDDPTDFWPCISPGNKNEETVPNDKLIDYIKFLNSYPSLFKYRGNVFKTVGELKKLVQKTKLEGFYSNKKFYADLIKIMDHNKK